MPPRMGRELMFLLSVRLAPLLKFLRDFFLLIRLRFT